jgi:hypothetical protein
MFSVGTIRVLTEPHFRRDNLITSSEQFLQKDWLQRWAGGYKAERMDGFSCLSFSVSLLPPFMLFHFLCFLSRPCNHLTGGTVHCSRYVWRAPRTSCRILPWRSHTIERIETGAFSSHIDLLLKATSEFSHPSWQVYQKPNTEEGNIVAWTPVARQRPCNKKLYNSCFYDNNCTSTEERTRVKAHRNFFLNDLLNDCIMT